MNLINIIRLKLIKFKSFFFRRRRFFDLRDYAFIRSSTELECLDDRSYRQYLAQSFRRFFLTNLIVNILAIPFIICFLFSNIRKTGFKETSIHNSNKIEPRAVFISNSLDLSIIPKSLNERYRIIDYYTNKISNNFSLDSEITNYYLKKYFRSPYFLLKILVKLREYYNILKNYNPDAIISMSEYSFSSSILTKYLRANNVLSINIMHGEKHLNLTDSFCEFDEFYVWDEYYVKLFKSLGVCSKEFKIEKPQFLKWNLVEAGLEIFDYTYILQSQSISELIIIRSIIAKIYKSGYNISIRLHPRYSISFPVRLLFYRYARIISEEYNLIHHMSLTKNVIGQDSTVLYQAHLNGKNVILDNISNLDLYNFLKSSKYHLIDDAKLLNELEMLS